MALTTENQAIVTQFESLAASGYVRLRVEFDNDVDNSWMDAEQLAEWDGEAYGTITEYLCPFCKSWAHADSVWGHIGYQNVASPAENAYVLDEMAEAIRLFHEASEMMLDYNMAQNVCPEN